jgi:hypothetical protein
LIDPALAAAVPLHAAHDGGEGMTGNRNLAIATRPHRTLENTADPQPHTFRRDDSAPPGASVKAKPASRVDLRSSLDTGPSPAYVRTQAGTGKTGHNRSLLRGLTRPRSFRDDPPGNDHSQSTCAVATGHLRIASSCVRRCSSVCAPVVTQLVTQWSERFGVNPARSEADMRLGLRCHGAWFLTGLPTSTTRTRETLGWGSGIN